MFFGKKLLMRFLEVKMSKYQVLLYYKYIEIEDPLKLLEEQMDLCQKLNLKGRIILAKEGINGTVEGLMKDTKEYIRFMKKDFSPGGRHVRFKSMHFKKSIGDGGSFPKLSIKVRPEIVSAHLGNDINPSIVTGKYLTPEELHSWIHSKKRFFIVDMRNDYEQAVGYFNNSLLAPFTNFRDLPKVLPLIKDLKNEVIVTVCTGGVRCEKASGFLVENGFKEVYQLYGGIVSYMEKYPNEDFLGSLYVFDGRVTMAFNLDSPKHVVVGKCKFCSSPAEKYFDCQNLYCQGKRHFISCQSCIEKYQGYCSQKCSNYQKTSGIVELSNSL
jgi:UPF0176 protein